MRAIVHISLVLLLFAFQAEHASAQGNVKVSGTVIDADSQTPMSGVTVSRGKESALNHLAQTDTLGRFTVNVPIGTNLVFSSIGFQTTTQKVGNVIDSMQVVMKTKDNPMNQVVVQGLRQTKRELSTGSSVSISGKEIQDIPAGNVMSLLQGRVAGVNIQNNTGSPGAMGTINIRGSSSIGVSSDGMLTPTSPLFVIDGVQVDVNSGYQYGYQTGSTGINPISLIPPEDIESFDFLKDATATSQYGAKATYGVIIITTKRGRSKVPVVGYSANFFLNTPPRLRQVLGGAEERAIRIRTIMDYDTASPEKSRQLLYLFPYLTDSLNAYYNNSTNWQDYFYGNTFNQTHNISIYGGDRAFSYKTNLNYYKENGIIRNTGFTRYQINMNATYQPSDKFRMIASLMGGLGTKQNGSGVGLFQTGVASGSNASSLLPPPSLFSNNNAVLSSENIRDHNKNTNILSNLVIRYQLIKGLQLQNDLGYGFNSGTSDRFTPSYLNNGSSRADNYNDRSYQLNNRTMLNYVRSFGSEDKTHTVSAYVFNEVSSSGAKANVMQLSQTPDDQIEGPIGANGGSAKGGTVSMTDSRQHGYGGTVEYNFATKYVLILGYRLDGTSINGPSRGYTKSPTVSGRWNFSKEDWFKNVSWLSYGGIRMGWGRNIRPSGNIFNVYGKYIYGPQYNNDPTVNIDFGNIPSPDFLPEIGSDITGGLDLGLFQNRVELSIEPYYRSNDNQIINIPLNNTNGFDRKATNTGSLVNKGLDWTFTFRIFKPEKPLQWTVRVTGNHNRGILARLPDGLREMEASVTDAGGSVPIVQRLGRNPVSNLLYYTNGIYASTADVPVNPATGKRQQLGIGSGFYFQGGDPRWVDVNGDYIIDSKDLQPIGNPEPLFFGGLLNELMLNRSLSLSINMAYVYKRDLLNAVTASQLQKYSNPYGFNVSGNGGLTPIDQYNYWKPLNADRSVGTAGAQYPNPFDFRRAGTLSPFRTNQTLFMEDGSYLKIGSIVLGYMVDRQFTQRYGISQLRVTLSANNVYTFSKYSGPNPENVTSLGRDVSGGYPSARTYAAGINVQF
ncbi:SusC/RagA family TonB-linked outer membrane protein [Niabella hirudinis]|uniref:SusC/RagA family TonB-linked outer membrane protein n=1 Tax=Niabella hirudinis TaxID=1285929 RepID=UPI003EBE55E2